MGEDVKVEEKQKMLPVLESVHRRVLVLKAKLGMNTVSDVLKLLLDRNEILL